MKALTPSLIIGLVVSFLVSTGIGYAVTPAGGSLISPFAGEESKGDTKKSTGFSQFANEPATEACPLNGKLYTASEKKLWEQKRPILAMIENHLESRPQSGISYADIVYEAVAEGGITRFMGVFYCGAQADTAKIAPVRSARMYFVNIAAEYNTPIYMHVGGGNCSAPDGSNVCTTNKKALALEELGKLGWRKAGGNDFDTILDSGFPVFTRDYNRLGENITIATEHTMVGSLPDAWRQATKRGYTNEMPKGGTWLSVFKPWKIDAKSEATGEAASSISFGFWDNKPDFDVIWKYDATSKQYLREQGGKPHVDLENTKQITAKNIIIQFAKEEGPLDEHMHMYYEVIGEGTGYLFRDGAGTEIKWKKPNQLGRTIFTDKSGKEITLGAGVTWVEILPKGNKVVYN